MPPDPSICHFPYLPQKYPGAEHAGEEESEALRSVVETYWSTLQLQAPHDYAMARDDAE